jgi:hypothetical protein
MQPQVDRLTCASTSTRWHSQAPDEPTRAPFATQSATHFDLAGEPSYEVVDIQFDDRAVCLHGLSLRLTSANRLRSARRVVQSWAWNVTQTVLAGRHARDPLPERLHRATRNGAPHPPHPDPHHHRPAICGHVRDRPLVIPVHLAGPTSASRARHRSARRPRPDHDHAVQVRHIVDDQGRQPREHDPRQFAYVTRGRPCHS